MSLKKSPAAQDYWKFNLLEGAKSDVSSTVIEKPETKESLPEETFHDASSRRLVIAIDYGTTFTGVAYATPASNTATLGSIELVDDWGPRMGNDTEVPSVYSYTPASNGERQWGADISPDAVTMVNTKLELDVQPTKTDELLLILQLLHGTNNLSFENVKKANGYPAYTWKTPEEVVTDYLTKVFEYLQQAVKHFGEHLRSQIPVDIVLTVPVDWSYRAKNSTLKAVKQAGFNEENFPNLNDIMVVTEPEVAALYTARHYKEDKKTEFLFFLRLRDNANRGQKDDCFVLADAGGGTVDVVSYQVTQLEPTLELEKMTIATSGKCGSTYIDAKFKVWLRKIIGERNYRELDPDVGQQLSAHTTEGARMRELIKAFEARKKAFSNKSSTVAIDLPKPLDKLNIPGRVSDGELKITREEMAKIFDPCVDRVLELILEQIQHVERKKRRVKNVFLVGGFGESPYLQEELQKSLEARRGIAMRRPDMKKSWTAVVQGAVIYGIEKAHHKNVTLMSPCPHSYAIVLNETSSVYNFDRRDLCRDRITGETVAQQQLTWLVKRGDLLLSDESRVFERVFTFNFSETDRRKLDLKVYEYPADDEHLPDRYENAQYELVEVGSIGCDLSQFSMSRFDRHRVTDSPGQRFYYSAELVCKARLSHNLFDVEILWKNKRVGYAKIKEFGLDMFDDHA